MNFYEKAIIKSELFIKDSILKYDQLRNYDFGPTKRDNVSGLSPFFSHRILFEYHLIDKILQMHQYSRVEKFIQEIFWRIYWKGWMEMRPSVWDNFLGGLNRIKFNKKDYENAINARTKLSCFNDWVIELKEYNYLHNHTRMWFASIWIFTLKLPWQLGAKFFLENLKDGDASSNTLSWKWVAGLQTKGKNYLANSRNIEKFTNNRYANIPLVDTAFPKTELFFPLIQKLPKNHNDKKYPNLVILDTDLFISDRIDIMKKYEKIYYILLDNEDRTIQISKNVYNFKKEIMYDVSQSLPNSYLISSQNFKNQINKLEGIDIIYPNVGENLDFIAKISKENHLKTNYLYREIDLFCWQYCQKGFFNFKKNIPFILNEIRNKHL